METSHLLANLKTSPRTARSSYDKGPLSLITSSTQIDPNIPLKLNRSLRVGLAITIQCPRMYDMIVQIGKIPSGAIIAQENSGRNRSIAVSFDFVVIKNNTICAVMSNRLNLAVTKKYMPHTAQMAT